ncbi:hypothetical protein GO613_03485 [Azoarcus communis]|uniref:Flagellar assembly protein T middle domain-containing protein n=1 Tax=Parazoarcus communis SWub3 = DSM 12120 TaxID=1121029 RepID=A0A323VAA1_9RHOO|nr:flagella assembly protein FlgT middle domain-containing protein [Parazoarcus communis]NMG47162.1 hypothetical protein [Parazoarcus communis]NMG70388.1 hypothetical protein [Parazoarcus communis SWub3 = DSM 12120]PZA17188.1 hypothetical protein DNK49_08105 [Azoarcus communis] [Parazoarcus communis SWub3 = DSM 12120]
MRTLTYPFPQTNQTGVRLLAMVMSASLLTACASLPSPQNEEARRQAELAEQARQAARPSSLCAADPGSPFALRKKVLVLGLPVSRPLQAADLPGLSSTWSRELQRRLRTSDRFLLRDGSSLALNPAEDTHQQIRTLARQFDVQFIVAGEVNDLSVQRGRIDLGPFKPIPQPFADRRTLSAVLDIYDGFSGTLIRQLTHHDAIKGRVDGNTLASNPESPLGAGIDTLISRQFDDVVDELACLPMQARLLPAAPGKLQINAGSSSNVEPGQRLRVFLHEPTPVVTGSPPTWQERPLGEFVVSHVYPEHAIGQIDFPIQPELRASAYVRAW